MESYNQMQAVKTLKTDKGRDKMKEKSMKKRPLSADRKIPLRNMSDNITRSDSRMSTDSILSQETEITQISQGRKSAEMLKYYGSMRSPRAGRVRGDGTEDFKPVQTDECIFTSSLSTQCPKLPPIAQKGSCLQALPDISIEDDLKLFSSAPRAEGVRGRMGNTVSPLPGPRATNWHQFSTERGLTDMKINQRTQRDARQKADRVPRWFDYDENYYARQTDARIPEESTRRRQRRAEKKVKRKQKREKPLRNKRKDKDSGEADF